MEKSAVEHALEKAGFSALLPEVDHLIRSSIRLKTTPADDATLAVGISKFGGLPDLPAELAWPLWKNQPQSFVAQLHLADLHQYDTGNLLPAQGMLWFFYDAQQETYGESPSDAGAWSILFRPGDVTNLQRATAPTALPETARFHASTVVASSELTLAEQPALEIAGLQWNDADQERYDTVYATFHGPASRTLPQHQLLGNPDTLQDDMRMQCQLRSHGVTDADDAQTKELAKGAQDWLLLLQVDSDEKSGMRWSSTGMLYYWIRQDDLHAAHFDKAWLVLQSE